MFMMNSLNSIVRSQMFYKCQFSSCLLILKQTSPVDTNPCTPPALLDFSQCSTSPEMQPPLTENCLCATSQPHSEMEEADSYFVLPGEKNKANTKLSIKQGSQTN